MKKLISLFLCILMIVSVSAPAFAATTDLTEEDIAGLTTKVENIQSAKDFTNAGLTMITDTPVKYVFKPASGDTKSYVLLENVNAGVNDGYFVMVQDGGLTADSTGSAIKALRNVYPGTCSDGNTEAPTVIFDKENQKSVAYYLNSEDYINSQFSVMKQYINDHTWYTETTNNVIKSVYSTVAKIALPSVTEYKVNIDRIGVNSIANGYTKPYSPTHFMLRTAHPGDGDQKHTSNKYTTKAIWLAKNTSGTLTMQIGAAVYYWQTCERPCFYLSKDFFKNVKLDMSLLKTQDSEVAKIIKEIASEENGIATLTKAGYTESDLTELGIATGSVKITSATIAGDGKCGNTITATVTTDGNADKTEYEWYGVKTDGTSTLLATTETNTYTVKFADLDYAKIVCDVKVYVGSDVSHSAYTNEIDLETKPIFPEYSSLAITADNPQGVQKTPEQYKFAVGAREFVVLNSVNAGANDGIFAAGVLPVYAEDTNWYTGDVTSTQKFVYDPADEKSIAYKINQSSFWNKDVWAGGSVSFGKVIPNEMREYLNVHRWWNEPINTTDENCGPLKQDAFATESKVALISYTEYRANLDRMGFMDSGLNREIVTRSPRFYNNGYGTKMARIMKITLNTENGWRFSQADAKSSDDSRNNFCYYQLKPICFYLNPDFFAEQKVDFDIDKNTEVVKILREKLESKTVDELRTIGYSLTEIKDLFPNKVAGYGKIAMIDFSKDGNNVKLTCVNLSDSEITFKPVAAVYASDAMICSNIGEEITLAKGESKPVNVTLDVGTSSPDTLKAFAWNVETLTPFAPCKTFNYTALAPET